MNLSPNRRRLLRGAIAVALFASTPTLALDPPSLPTSVRSIEALRSLPYRVLTDGSVVEVQAYYPVGAPIGGGRFAWSSSDTQPDDGGLVINPSGNSGPGRWLRQIGEGPKTFAMFGARGNGEQDDTEAIQAALQAGSVFVSAPSHYYRVSSTIWVPSQRSITGSDRPKIRLQLPPGAPVVPLLVTARSKDNAEGITIQGIEFDHAAGDLGDPESGNPAHGSAIILRANYSKMIDCTVRSAWDNGVVVGDPALQGEREPTPGTPYGIEVRGVHTHSCGIGEHKVGSLPGKGGAGINVAGGSFTTVTECKDFSSYGGFGVDTGGGAHAVFIGCIAYSTLRDRRFYWTGGGRAFVFQSARIKAVGCVAMFPATEGFWFSSSAEGSQAVGCEAYGAGRNSYWINASGVMLIGCRSQNPSQERARVFDGIRLQVTFVPVRSVVISGCICEDAEGKSRYGYNEVAVTTEPEIGNGKTFPIEVVISGSIMNGGVAPYGPAVRGRTL